MRNKIKTIILMLMFSTAILGASENEQISLYVFSAKGSTAEYSLLLTNNGPVEHTYNFNTSNLPADYKVVYLTGNRAIDHLQLKAGENKPVTMMLSIPAETSNKMEYFTFDMIREDHLALQIPLALEVNDDFGLQINSKMNNATVINGQSLTMDISVTNTGTNILKNVSLQFDLPKKWLVEDLKPAKMTLKANESGLYKVTVSVPASQTSGSSNITVKAVSGTIKSSIISVPVAVKSNPSLIYISIALLIMAMTGTIVFFRKHGRR